MSRSLHAFNAVERRIDRDADKARKQQQREFVATLAKTMADGFLGGFNDERRSDVCEAGIRELCSRLKALQDGPAVAGLIGSIANDLCSDIKGGRLSAIQEGHARFDRLTKSGEGA